MALNSPAHALEPLEQDAEALEAVARLARAGELVGLVGKRTKSTSAAGLERHEELFGLLDRAAQVVLGVQDQQRRRDVLGVGQRRMLQIPLPVLPG